jgi:thymidine phosphorylase
MGVRSTALITDMDQPLGTHVGNALEVLEVLEVLRGRGATDLRVLCLELAGWMLHLGGKAHSARQGKQLAEELLSSGKALEKFREMIELQSGDPGIVDDPSLLPHAHSFVDVESPQAGYVAGIDCERIGNACLLLGGGRERMEDAIDHAVGFVLHKKVGDPVATGEPWCTIHYNSEPRLHRARHLLETSCQIAARPPEKQRPLIHRVIQDEY